MKEALAKYCLETLNQYKSYMGLTDYSVRLHTKVKNIDGTLADVEADYYEKELTVQLYSGFLKLPEPARKKVLIHELVHARIAVFHDKSEKLIADEEESLANDLTTAIVKAEDV